MLHGNAGYAYLANLRDTVAEGFDLNTLGLPASLKQAAQFAIFPRIAHAARPEKRDDLVRSQTSPRRQEHIPTVSRFCSGSSAQTRCATRNYFAIRTGSP